ncbi:glycosyl hydrolase family 9 [Sphaerochaeta pleomorpha str. Grapes]|uniref:Glycosyl hydrolase family 9 n=1 Tax=Sphaerochaeta pleomorpha (strain ATCC BAA-1885 / DSM 22778 / Grapes) TaxID=158190 RepID=G8QS98_SPHPG|nr:glycoside hydrolase family 9 protein [Sphaerochaeta pleomorpha]AEV30028.1 glycosyl hydrolase family 9 [Sphaerochaeta pleomorpha str. Grapes]
MHNVGTLKKTRTLFLLLSYLSVVLLSCNGGKVEQPSLTVSMAAPKVLVVSFTDSFNPDNLVSNPLKSTSSDWVVNARHPQTVYVAARSRDELPKTQKGDYPIETEYKIYLVLDESFQNGESYMVSGPFGSTSFLFDDKTMFCESIKVNQEGYHPQSSVRYANLGIFLGNGGSLLFPSTPAYKVLDAKTQNVLVMGKAEFRGDDTKVEKNLVSSGEYVYRLDLSAVPEGGPYVIQIEGCGVSYPFEISYTAVEHIAYTYTRGLYHQRCGIALQKPYTEFTRDACHTEVGLTRNTWSASGKIEVDSRSPMLAIYGGYHDAGDFDRRPYHTIIPILLLGYYEAFPDHFIDSQYNLPESGNGLPDFLDEALWGIASWEQLQILDERDHQRGGIMAGTETSGHPEYGKTNAATDSLVYGTWAVSEEVTAYGAGMMAQAARLLYAFPLWRTKAQELFDRAMLAWNYLDTKMTDKGFYTENTETSAMLYASLQLSLALPLFEPQLEHLQEKLQILFETLATKLLVEDGYWPQQYRPGNAYAQIQTVHFSSYLLTQKPHDLMLAETLKKLVFDQADKGGYMGFDMEKAFYPQGATKTYGWGAATAQGRYADVYAFAYRMETDAKKKQSLFDILCQFGDYDLGLNPLGKSFVTGLGVDQVQSPLHLDSWFTRNEQGLGNVPGILVYGPSEERSKAEYQMIVSNTLFPSWDKLPLQRRWADGWSLVNNNEFTVWETMVWNICLYGVLNTPTEGKSSTQ